jgi:hypothetical protein
MKLICNIYQATQRNIQEELNLQDKIIYLSMNYVVKCDTWTGILKREVWMFRMDWTEVEIWDISVRFLILSSMFMKTEFW